jgi:hypothetical protein
LILNHAHTICGKMIRADSLRATSEREADAKTG